MKEKLMQRSRGKGRKINDKTNYLLNAIKDE
jgi:hypothetical protein